MLLFSPVGARDRITALITLKTQTKLNSESWGGGVKRQQHTHTKKKKAETQLRGGMASRQGGSFNSILGRRKSPLARPSSEQQRARREQFTRQKHTIIDVSSLTFLVLGRPTAPGSLCLWGTLFCVGGRPPSLSFLFFPRYFICQIDHV